MEEKRTGKAHKLELLNRREGTVTGVKDVKSFDEKLILLATDWGTITIKGEELHVSQLNLDSGEVRLTGRVDSVAYSEKGSGNRESFLERIFQ